MKTSWWRSQHELDDDQKAFIKLPPYGRYSLIGPPGSGKTNLLLLRAQFVAGSGEKNILIITYGKALADFIRSGIGASGLISPKQVKTYHSWASSHVIENLGPNALPKSPSFDDGTRVRLLELVQEANARLATRKLYSAIFVDEAQDLTLDEIEALLSLSENVCICGDSRQGIFDKDGLRAIEKLKLKSHDLKRHFRIGQRIARVADRLLPPDPGIDSLEATSNYNPKSLGESSAVMHVCANREEQFAKLLELIRVQLVAFAGDSIGIICGTNETLSGLQTMFQSTDLAGQIAVHGLEKDASFSAEKAIHILTIHAAKGTEFRAVHMFGLEDLAKFPLNRRKLSYTAITRTKTALNAYRTGETNHPLENAFAIPALVSLDDLFPRVS